jgi:hypothetical protein
MAAIAKVLNLAGRRDMVSGPVLLLSLMFIV